MAQAGNVVIHLDARQLTTFAGFCTLDDLDLQFVGIGEVVDCHAKSAASHLFDRGAS